MYEVESFLKNLTKNPRLLHSRRLPIQHRSSWRMKSVLQTTGQDKADNRSISVTRLMPDCIQPCQIWPCSGKIWASRCSNVSDIYIYIKASNLGQLWVRSKEIQGQESSEGCLWVSRWKILRSRNKWSRNQTRHWAAHPRQNKTSRDKAKNGRKASTQDKDQDGISDSRDRYGKVWYSWRQQNILQEEHTAEKNHLFFFLFLN